MSVDIEADDELEFLSTVDGEIAFFRGIMKARPVGIHRHFHVVNIRNSIFKDTGHAISVQVIWNKLRDLYDMDALEAIDLDNESYEPRSSENSTPVAIPSPSPSDNLAAHPFFRDEYTLPYDAKVEEMIAQRRMRDTPSPISPRPSPQPMGRTRASKHAKRGRSKLDLAGLVGGDSDSSALTQESGDEGMPTPRDSATITEGGTEYGDEDVDMRDASPDPSAPSPSSRGTRKRTTSKKAAATATTRTRGATSAANRATKKKKR
ncbi:hypothetical protein R3P38DRAFT_2869123 [Favolaschia claudopus]|uniref:MRG-binding protein n=1 Tax=Favolaschia claudopus TaxID=2862362 RepID=A0AAW0DAY1_9AGAR